MIKYNVHYQGWSKSWDELVPENRVLKFNESNLERQKELNAQSEAAKKKKKKPVTDDLNNFNAPSPSVGESRSGKTSTRAAAQVSASTSGKQSSSSTSAAETDPKALILKKLKSEPQVESEADYTVRVEVQIKIPDELKSWLVDDWDLIVRQKKLVSLGEEIPKSFMTVDRILEEYVKTKSKGANKVKESELKDITDGIREYFNAMLGCQLIYKFERPQFQRLDKTVSDDVPMSSVYGVSHLVRLFVKLGQMLAYTNLDQQDMERLKVHLQDFLKFLVKTNYFNAGDYVTAPPEYIKKVQN